jgi:hypothetical protein
MNEHRAPAERDFDIIKERYFSGAEVFVEEDAQLAD